MVAVAAGCLALVKFGGKASRLEGRQALLTRLAEARWLVK